MSEYIDISMLDKVQRQRRFINDFTGEIIEEENLGPLPEDIVSELEDHVGDGLARVTVSGALSSSVRFHKAESFVSVSLSCNNSMGDVLEVHDIMRPFVQKLAAEDHDHMAGFREEILSEGTSSVPAPLEEKVAEPPKRSSRVKLVGKNKPDYRRGK